MGQTLSKQATRPAARAAKNEEAAIGEDDGFEIRPWRESATRLGLRVKLDNELLVYDRRDLIARRDARHGACEGILVHNEPVRHR